MCKTQEYLGFIKIYAFFMILTLIPQLSYSQENENSDDENKKDRIIPKYINPPVKDLSQKAKKSVCEKHKDSYVGYSGFVFYVTKSCKLNDVTHNAGKLTRQKVIIKEVSADILKALKLLKDDSLTLSKGATASLLKRVDGHCVGSMNHLFLVEKNKKRKFPDWESFVDFSNKKKCKLIALTSKEIESIPRGEDMKSILDEAFKKNHLETDTVELISLKSACSRLQKAKYYSHHEQVFVLEKPFGKLPCGLKQVDAQALTKKLAASSGVQEMSLTTYFSIPKKILPLKD